MFTGIIEEVGEIKAVRKGKVSCTFTIKGNAIFNDLKIGDSVAVNGVCLTATTIRGNEFTADVMAETLRRTNLGTFTTGTKVNLERAMAADGRFGGHIVSGHIDGTGTITKKRREENAVWVTVSTTPEIMHYIVEKGSVAIDGISLTVAEVGDGYFKVSIIPHTGAETTLLTKNEGAVVNLENDEVAKYVEKLTSAYSLRHGNEGGKGGVTMADLLENGFL